MTKYSDRSYMDDTEMQSDMAEGSASWADGDNADDFPEASGSGSGPGKRRESAQKSVKCRILTWPCPFSLSLSHLTAVMGIPTIPPARNLPDLNNPIAVNPVDSNKVSFATSLHNNMSGSAMVLLLLSCAFLMLHR